ATRAGLSPQEASEDEVGCGGISLVDANDLNVALKDVDLGAIPVHLNAGYDALPLAALYIEAVRRTDQDLRSLTGDITADPIGQWIARGQLPAPLATLYDSLATWTTWAESSAPGLRTVAVDARLWSNAGGTATQELAFALATAVDYLRALEARNVLMSVAAPRMDFAFAIGPQFFTEVAKLRAFRPLWTRVLTAFGLAPEAAAGASVGAATGTLNKTLLDPHVNLLRVTTEALSAVLGGCDRLHIAPFDEVAGTTNEFSRRIARNIHPLLAEEFSFAETADAAGGSWYVEKLTDELAKAAWILFQEIERRGGMAAALRDGYPQGLIEKAMTEKRDAVAKRRVALVGTNLFPNLRETPLENNRRTSSQRNLPTSRWSGAGELAETVQSFNSSTRFSAALNAARDGATIGQLRQVTRGANASCETIAPVIPKRVAEDFESLRLASMEFARRAGARPRVFLARMGPLNQHKARADFSVGFFAVGGFEVIGKQSFASAEEAAATAIGSNAEIVVLCSSDETYPALVPAFAAAVRGGASRSIIVLAGLPADSATVATFRGCGIDEFIHLRANVHEVLAGCLKKLETNR
ncbi:MAG TPA: methylmalonyl-CoA mutase family protein, partial [Opitutus sp.]|nr:methylmalonyl-CoA mutase family protein [Opitutus sp.]